MKDLTSPSPSSTPDASATPSATPEASATPSATPETSATPSMTPEASATPSSTPEASTSPSASSESGSYSPENLWTEPDPAPTPTSLVERSPSPEASPTPSALPDWLPSPSGSILPDVMDKLNNVDWDAAEDEINKAQQNTYDTASDTLVNIQHTIQSQAALAGFRVAAAQTSLSNSFGQIITDMDLLNTMLNGQNQIVLQDFQAIFDELNIISNIITNPETVNPNDIFTDISDEDKEADMTGKVTNCINKGKIYGDLNLGGIAGSMSKENNLDPEDDLALDNDNATLNFRYKERIVIRSCQNTASVEGKKNCVGGIAGDMVLGSIMESINTGSVTSDGDMIGGIAGNCASAIRSCSAKCTLSGENQIGGIAGYGTTITDCYSMIQIQAGKDYLGSIAGKSDFKSASEMNHNYFVLGFPAAIDGINYTSIAEPLSYDEFITSPNLPDVFRHIYLTFEADGHTVSTITLDYGASLDPTKIPSVPAKENCSGKWADFDDNDITYDQTIEAIYSEYIATIESIPEKEGRAVILAEGQFTPQDNLIATPIDAYPADGQTLAECWKVNMHTSFSGPYIIHYLVPSNMEHPTLELLQDASWVPIEYTQDGSYFVFSSAQSDFVFCCTDRPAASHTSMIILIAACAITLFCVLGGIYLYRRNNHGKKSSGKM